MLGAFSPHCIHPHVGVLLNVVPNVQHPAGVLTNACISFRKLSLDFFLPLINVRNIVLSCTLYPSISLISSPRYSVCAWDCSVLMSLSVTIFKDCIFREAGDGKDLLETVSSCLRKQESFGAGFTACRTGNAAFGLWGWHMRFFQHSTLVKANLA